MLMNDMFIPMTTVRWTGNGQIFVNWLGSKNRGAHKLFSVLKGSFFKAWLMTAPHYPTLKRQSVVSKMRMHSRRESYAGMCFEAKSSWEVMNGNYEWKLWITAKNQLGSYLWIWNSFWNMLLFSKHFQRISFISWKS